MTLHVAILGSGNIGTDLMYKVIRNPVLELAGVAGADPSSEGLARARALGVATSDRGAGPFLAEHPEVTVAFDATSAHAHVQHAPLLAARGIRCIDLTPAALGPAVVPDVNLDEHLDAPDANLITCGAQATVPVVAALSALGPVRYAEIVSTVASRSAGPGTRSNIDEFTVATARSLETLGGAGGGRPRCGGPGGRLRARLPPGHRAARVRRPAHGLHRGGGRRRLPAALRREPRHHDVGGRPGRGTIRGEADSMSDAANTQGIRLLDSTLRDGSHGIRHRYTPQQVELIAGQLDQAGVHSIGVGHGDGLGASSIQYMRSLHTDDELLTAARRVIKQARLAVTFQPGIGTKQQLERAAELGADLVRIATHCTEADIAVQHIGLSRDLGMDVHGDLMMPHMTTPETIARQGRIMVDAGATGVHIMDSAGALTMDDTAARIAAMLAEFGAEAEAGIHAHQNLSLAVANTMVAFAEGATLADACLAGAGAGAGNCQLEALVAVMDKAGLGTGIDLWTLEDIADQVVRPIMTTPPIVDRATLTQGFAGVPGSFLHHAFSAADRFGVDARDILVEVGRRKSVGGQEDLVIEVAARLAASERPAAS